MKKLIGLFAVAFLFTANYGNAFTFNSEIEAVMECVDFTSSCGETGVLCIDDIQYLEEDAEAFDEYICG
ncbi:hypothetical protein [Sinomicrobium sp. M5D2P9]